MPLTLAKTSEVPPGTAKKFDFYGRPALLVNVGGEFKAYLDVCLHRGGPMVLEGGNILRCEWHNATWDAATGKALTQPAPEGSSLIPVFIRVVGDTILTIR